MPVQGKNFIAYIKRRLHEDYGDAVADRFARDGKIVYKYSDTGKDIYGIYFTLYSNGLDIHLFGGIFGTPEKRKKKYVHKRLKLEPPMKEQVFYELVMHEVKQIINGDIIAKMSSGKGKEFAKNIAQMLKRNE